MPGRLGLGVAEASSGASAAWKRKEPSPERSRKAGARLAQPGGGGAQEMYGSAGQAEPSASGPNGNQAGKDYKAVGSVAERKWSRASIGRGVGLAESVRGRAFPQAERRGVA